MTGRADNCHAVLVTPSEKYLRGYYEACTELKESKVYPPPAHDPDMFYLWKDTIFEYFYNCKHGVHLKPGWVPSDTFWLVDEKGFIGSGNIRHRLTDALKRYGGHIGYFIRPSRQSLGYGTLQLGLLLLEAKKLCINSALVTCNLENRASARVIEKNGGKLQDIIDNHIDGRDIKTCRYWI